MHDMLKIALMPIRTFFASAAVILLGVIAATASAAETSNAPVTPPYKKIAALSSLINPHNQISDEGDILWGTCLICHKNTPDEKKERSVDDVRLRFPDSNQTCTLCHLTKQHPGSEGIGVIMSGMIAPNHLTKPRKDIALNMRFALKDVRMILPLDPKNGKIFCATCHNPHERGVLSGRANSGADYNLRLRSANMDICQYCHRK